MLKKKIVQTLQPTSQTLQKKKTMKMIFCPPHTDRFINPRFINTRPKDFAEKKLWRWSTTHTDRFINTHNEWMYDPSRNNIKSQYNEGVFGFFWLIIEIILCKFLPNYNYKSFCPIKKISNSRPFFQKNGTLPFFKLVTFDHSSGKMWNYIFKISNSRPFFSKYMTLHFSVLVRWTAKRWWKITVIHSYFRG